VSTKIGQAPRVVVAYHTTGLTHSGFTRSLAHSLIYEGARVEDVVECVSPYVVEARNALVVKYLKRYRGLYLLMVDADIEFPEDAITRSVVAAAANDIPLLCGAYVQGSGDHAVFVQHEGTGLFSHPISLQPGVLYRNMYAGGTGWMLIRRDVLEAMERAFPDPYQWFDRDVVEFDPANPACADLVNNLTSSGGKARLGEDTSFCRRAHALGYEVAVHTGLELIHHKSKGTVHRDFAPLFTDRPDVVFLGGQVEIEENSDSNGAGGDPSLLRRGQGDSAGQPGDVQLSIWDQRSECQPYSEPDASGEP
jgi:hypothetical protein